MAWTIIYILIFIGSVGPRDEFLRSLSLTVTFNVANDRVTHSSRRDCLEGVHIWEYGQEHIAGNPPANGPLNSAIHQLLLYLDPQLRAM